VVKILTRTKRYDSGNGGIGMYFLSGFSRSACF
jgi:hypothetical protein